MVQSWAACTGTQKNSQLWGKVQRHTQLQFFCLFGQVRIFGVSRHKAMQAIKLIAF